MPRGDKSPYTDKQKRKAEHIEEGYKRRGVPKDEAERRAWATVNKIRRRQKSGSGYGKPDNKEPARKGGRTAGGRGVAYQGRALGIRKEGRGNTQAQCFVSRTIETRQPLVGRGNRAQQCAGFQEHVFEFLRSQAYRDVAEAVGRGELAPQGRAVSIRNVDADLLRQSCRQELSDDRRAVLEKAKDELRDLFGRE